jgi:hypothetical protein
MDFKAIVFIAIAVFSHLTVASAQTLTVTTANLEHLMSFDRFKAWVAYCEPLNWDDNNAQPSAAAKPPRMTYCNALDGRLFPPIEGQDILDSRPVRTEAAFDEKLGFLRTTLLSLASDVVALQEVADRGAVMQIFSDADWHIITTDDPIPQNVAVVVRRNGAATYLGHRVVDALAQADPDGRKVRSGLEVSLHINVAGVLTPVRLLNVHLKAGCRSAPLGAAVPPAPPDYAALPTDAARKDARRAHDRAVNCYVMRKQVPVLEQWVEEQAASGMPFMIVGDWNRDSSNDLGKNPTREGGSDPATPLTPLIKVNSLIKEISDNAPTGATVRIAQIAMPDRRKPVAGANGVFDPAYHDDIDLFALSPALLALTTLGPERPQGTCADFGAAAFQVIVARPSDHCPATVVLPLR